MVTNNKTLKKLHDIQTQCSARLSSFGFLTFQVWNIRGKKYTRTYIQPLHADIRIHARIGDSRKHNTATLACTCIRTNRADTPSVGLTQ